MSNPRHEDHVPPKAVADLFRALDNTIDEQREARLFHGVQDRLGLTTRSSSIAWEGIDANLTPTGITDSTTIDRADHCDPARATGLFGVTSGSGAGRPTRNLGRSPMTADPRLLTRAVRAAGVLIGVVVAVVIGILPTGTPAMRIPGALHIGDMPRSGDPWPTISFPSTSATTPGLPWEGGTWAAGTPISLADLPTQIGGSGLGGTGRGMKQNGNSHTLWAELSTCDPQPVSAMQTFLLRGFTRLEVVLGAEGTVGPDVAVRSDIFVNNDLAAPIASMETTPGESHVLTVDLPQNTTALTLRSTLVGIDGQPACRTIRASWGSPRVIAAGR